MKKTICILLAIMMLSLCAIAAAEEYPQPEGGKKFESDWAIAGGLVEIYYEEEGYRVTLSLETEENKSSTWEYSCFYQEETDCLLSFTSSRTDFTMDPDTGDVQSTDIAYEGFDEEGQATTFTIDDHGCLIWKDGHEDAGAGLEFVNIGRFDGLWRNDAEEVEVEFLWNGLYEDDATWYTVYIQRGKEGAEHFARFLMNGVYDSATGKLTANGTCTVFTKNASGEYDYQDDGETLDAIFSILENGNLLYETANGIELEYDIMGH